MRPAGNAHDIFVLLGKAVIGTIAIGLQDAFKAIEQTSCFVVFTTKAPVEDNIASWSSDYP